MSRRLWGRAAMDRRRRIQRLCASRSTRSALAWLLVVMTAVGCSNPFVDRIAFRPPTAVVTSSPTCLAENIVTGLTGLGPWDQALAGNAPEPGYPPADFRVVGALRCERGTDASGMRTIDSVRLDGDMAAVLSSFTADSYRSTDGTASTCMFFGVAPVGLWLVDDTGAAFRPAWPSDPCNLQDGPYLALRKLTEIGRSSHPTGLDDRFTTGCERDSHAASFEPTTADDVAAAEEHEREYGRVTAPTLTLPVDDVDALVLCTYEPPDSEAAPDGGDVVAGTRTVLDRGSSAELVRSIVDAPLAPACDQSSTRVASTELVRPDGSGSTPVSFELDGCRRVAGLGDYRVTPPAALTALSSAS